MISNSNGIYLVRFGFRMWKILFFLPLKIQTILLKKTRFWKEKSVEDMVTLGANGTQATLILK
jgi:hypothetical protein